MSMCAPSAGPHGKFAVINKENGSRRLNHKCGKKLCELYMERGKKKDYKQGKLSTCRCVLFNLQATYVALDKRLVIKIKEK